MLLLDCYLVHYLNGKRLLRILEHAKFHCSKRTLSKGLAKEIAILDIFELLEFLEVNHVEGL